MLNDHPLFCLKLSFPDLKKYLYFVFEGLKQQHWLDMKWDRFRSKYISVSITSSFKDWALTKTFSEKISKFRKKEEFGNDLNSFKIPTIHHLSANFFGRSSLIGFCNHFTFLWFPTAFSLHFINFANFLPDWLSSPTLQKLEDFAQIDKWKELKHKAVQKVKE